MKNEGAYYTVDEAARILELSPACVRQMLRAGELEGERREERIEGVLGPWRLPRHVVHVLREGNSAVLRAKRRAAACDVDTASTTELPPGEAVVLAPEPLSGEATTNTLPEVLLPDEEVSADEPSEASDLLSESVREVQEKVEALRKELELLEGRLELMEITESALREGLRREKKRADTLQAELEAERTRRRQEPKEESRHWLSKG